MNKTYQKHTVSFIYIFLALVTAAVFLRLINCDFINFDDPAYVYTNRNVFKGLTLENIKWAFTSTAEVCNWHPLTWLSHMLDCELFGLKAGGHHLTNILLHTANVLLLFTFLRKTTATIWQSAFAAAVFAVHPLHVESVAWVSERKDVLSTLFWMLTMLAYAGYVRKSSVGRYLATLILFAVGLMGKPMLVTLPFVLLLLDYWPLERFELSSKLPIKILGRLIIEKIPFFVLSAISSVVTFIAQQSVGAVASVSLLPMNHRIINALVSYLRYIGKMIWPTNLAAFYPHPSKISTEYVSIAVIVLVLVTIVAIRQRRKRRYILVGWLWYLGTLVPVIGIVQVGSQAIADRYTYISLIGLFLIIAWQMPSLFKSQRLRKMVLAPLALIVLGLLSIGTYIQTGYWQNSIILFGHALKVTSNNGQAHCSLGMAYAQERNFDKAIAHLNSSIQIKNDFPDPHAALASVYYEQGRFEKAEEHYKLSLRFNLKKKAVYAGLALSLYKQNKLDEAILYYLEALKLDPQSADFCNDLGMIFTQQGKFDKATEYLTKSIEIKPDFAEAYANFGYALVRQGKFADAVAHLTKAAELDSNMSRAHYFLAVSFNKTDNPASAITHYKRALQLKPDDTEAMNDLAWLLAANGNPQYRNSSEAVELAEQACKLTGYKNAAILDTLAVAYASADKFPEAMATAEKAIELAKTRGQKKLLNEIISRLALYKAGQPYYEKLSTNSGE